MANNLDNYSDEIRRQAAEAFDVVEALKKKQIAENSRGIKTVLIVIFLGLLFCCVAYVIGSAIVSYINDTKNSAKLDSTSQGLDNSNEIFISNNEVNLWEPFWIKVNGINRVFRNKSIEWDYSSVSSWGFYQTKNITANHISFEFAGNEGWKVKLSDANGVNDQGFL
jgi:hypothetical protein